MRTHVLDALAHVDPEVDRVHMADRVRNRALRVLVDFERCFDRGLEISKIVQRIENSKNIDAVDSAALNEFVDKVIGVVAIPEDILAAETAFVAAYSASLP